MSVAIEKFTNKSGKEIRYISVQSKDMKYPIRIGIKKLRAILQEREAIEMVLANMGIGNNLESNG